VTKTALGNAKDKKPRDVKKELCQRRHCNLARFFYFPFLFLLQMPLSRLPFVSHNFRFSFPLQMLILSLLWVGHAPNPLKSIKAESLFDFNFNV